jgi:hypothetical protein
VKTACAPPLVRICVSVLATVDFDDQAVLEADEIDDAAFDRPLAPKFRADLAGAQ